MYKYYRDDRCLLNALTTDEFIVVTNKGRVCKANYVRCMWNTDEDLSLFEHVVAYEKIKGDEHDNG